MNPLASRKNLLIAESELNRAHLSSDLSGLTAGVRALVAQAQTLRSIASSATALITGLAALRRPRRSVDAGTDSIPSRWPGLLKSADLISTLWLALRPARNGKVSD